MHHSQRISLNWDSQANTGSVSLILDMKILGKYYLPQILTAYNQEHQIGLITYPCDSSQAYEAYKVHVEGYRELLSIYHLDAESDFHGSHLFYLMVENTAQQSKLEHQQEVKRRLHNRFYLLKHLMDLEHYDSYNIEVYDTVKNFKYHFGSEPILKRSIIKYMVGEMKAQIKEYDRKLYKRLIDGATLEELAAAVERLSEHEIRKVMTAKLAREIVTYLNNETQILSNPSRVDDLSVSNTQGDFIYDILTHFGLYQPKQRTNSTVVRHHDTIRKLIKRSAV
ncbi:hypothetical protein ACFQZS_14015 [Mucilaginibacter calamicampi]|uniref:Uncharacterized protein n=1 Tax=Mucilaginibacter calamicampi TaxID=1302352 RepID=A0ABW2YY08_9SPHI